MTDKIHELLHAWFGNAGSADLPSSDRTDLWFGEKEAGRQQMLETFQDEYRQAVLGELAEWAKTPRGRLALIILLDQFSRMMHHQSQDAFLYDQKATELSTEGLRNKMDQSLTLIERVFFYMPLVHAENNALQEQSIRLYEELVVLSMAETTQIYQLFLAYAYAHFRVIKTFGRFPQRNEVLGRVSTEAELAFLKRASAGS
ncbi:MAG: hypothetical protein A3F43_03005 [Gammaproteobacteria bacterium RIFCSPHIGHO2_12_FULL_42_10]|nr:MAG: hypothetical protein A3F43_03005 [Gammaproteobacteria bacterium RIFCSPHIGHO2_12_FULL_42_10]